MKDSNQAKPRRGSSVAMSKASGDEGGCEIAYCNVDVELYSSESLAPLIAALGRKIIVHEVGTERNEHCARFALASWKNSRSPDAAIRALARHVEALPRAPRRLWNNARRKVFNIGFQSSVTPHSREYEISEAAMRGSVKLGAALVITIYQVDLSIRTSTL